MLGHIFGHARLTFSLRAHLYDISVGYCSRRATWRLGRPSRRPLKEETGLDIFNPTILCVSNNLEIYREEGLHVIAICLMTKEFSGVPTLMEPDKCEGWHWCDPTNLPGPHFEASRRAVKCYLEGGFYRQG